MQSSETERYQSFANNDDSFRQLQALDQRWDILSPRQSHLREATEASPISRVSFDSSYEHKVQGYGRSVAISGDGHTIAVGASDGRTSFLHGADDDFVKFQDDWDCLDDDCSTSPPVGRKRCYALEELGHTPTVNDFNCLVYRDSMFVQVLRTCDEDAGSESTRNRLDRTYGADTLIGKTGCIPDGTLGTLGASAAGQTCVADFTPVFYKLIVGADDDDIYESGVRAEDDADRFTQCTGTAVMYKIYRNFCEDVCSVGIFYGNRTDTEPLAGDREQEFIRTNEHFLPRISHLGRAVALSEDGNTLAFADIGASLVQVWVYDRSLPRCHSVRSRRKAEALTPAEFGAPKCWTQLGLDIRENQTNPDGADPVRRRRDKGGPRPNFFGEALAMSGDGRTIAVGARRHANSRGRVEVYSYDGATEDWVPMTTSAVQRDGAQAGLSGEWENAGFGSSVSLSDDGLMLAIGAPGRNLIATQKGYVDIFRFDGAAGWIEAAPGINKVIGVLSGPQSSVLGDTSMFGKSVALHRSVGTPGGTYRLAIGIPKAVIDSPSGVMAGAVDVYEHTFDCNQHLWQQLGSRIFGPDSGSLFGSSVAISEGKTSYDDAQVVLVVGAPLADEVMDSASDGDLGQVLDNTGHALVFLLDSSEPNHNDWRFRQANFAREAASGGGRVQALEYVPDSIGGADVLMGLRIPQDRRIMFDEGELTSRADSFGTGRNEAGQLRIISRKNGMGAGFGTAIALSRGTSTNPLRLVIGAPGTSCGRADSKPGEGASIQNQFPCGLSAQGSSVSGAHVEGSFHGGRGRAFVYSFVAVPNPADSDGSSSEDDMIGSMDAVTFGILIGLALCMICVVVGVLWRWASKKSGKLAIRDADLAVNVIEEQKRDHLLSTLVSATDNGGAATTVTIVTEPGYPTGLNIVGPETVDEPYRGCFLSSIADGSAASSVEGIREGMQLLAVNGAECAASMTKDDCVRLVASARRQNPTQLALRLRYDPSGYLAYDGGQDLDMRAQTDIRRTPRNSVDAPQPPATDVYAAYHEALQQASSDCTIAEEQDFGLWMEVGDRVSVIGRGCGVVRFVGQHHVDGTPRVGVELDEATGLNDGTVNGDQYFSCPARHGVLTTPKSVQQVDPSEL